jgi:hypothetical protein
MSIGKLGKTLAVLAALTSMFLVVSASAESKARIVRLSDVQGTVKIDRAAGQGFEKAFLNLPLVEGSKLKTGDDGRAEVEFEDGSAVRLAQNSQIEFPRLALGDDGQKLTTVKMISGVMYINVRPSKGDQLQINFGRESVTVTEPAHFRVDFGDTDATLSVFKGKVNGTGPSGQFEVGDKHSATFDLANNDSIAMNKNYDQYPNDDWDKRQVEYHDRYAANSTYSMSSPYGYGLSDLNYYGNFIMIPGYGWGWQPYLVDASWSPFMNGAWAWYPGFGYMWVSGYPWGWMPFYYGNWNYAGGYGWFWQPGYWNNWVSVPTVVNPPARAPFPKPPVRGTAIVMVGKGLVASPARMPSHLAVRPGSAGWGVPRGSIRDYDRVAAKVVRTARPATVRSQMPPSTPTWSQNPWESNTSIRSMGSGSVGGRSMGSGSMGGARMGGTAPRTSSPPARTSPHR